MHLDRRKFLVIGTATLSACATRTGAVRAVRFDAMVGNDARVEAPRFPSLKAAIEAAPGNATSPHRIFVGPGRWHEKLHIDKPFIHLIGAGVHRSLLTYNDYAGLEFEGKPIGTMRTATLTVRAPDFSATHLTIENAFDYLSYLNRLRDTLTTSGAQAVALMLSGNADRSRIANCSIDGFQDTLLVDTGRSYFTECKVSGNVDFIFGAGRAFFERCEIVSRRRPGDGRQGIISAPSTLSTQEHGLVFDRCRLTKQAGMPANSVALGRAWRPTRDFPDGRYGDPRAVGSAVYRNCWMDDHIAREGWDPMYYGARDGSRLALQPQDARFFEYQNRGLGAQKHAQRRELSAQDARQYDIDRVLTGWRGG
jgi:pectinesterase